MSIDRTALWAALRDLPRKASAGWSRRGAGVSDAGVPPRAWPRIGIGAVAVAGFALLAVAAFPWGIVARRLAAPASRALGRPVTIGDARRIDRFGLTPTIELRDVRVGQPAWAGGGEMASVRALRVRVPILPLLVGQVRPRAIEVTGLRATLVRDANGRSNWTRSSGKDGGKGGGGPDLSTIVVRDARLRLQDAMRQMAVDATIAIDRAGVRVAGSGTLRGRPLALTVAGPSLGGVDRARPYALRVAVRSPLASLAGDVLMDRALDARHFTAHITASGQDVGYLDDIIQAGLFRTQPFRLAGTIRHDDRDWRISRLGATIGRSRFVARLVVTKPNGRTHLDGGVDARTLDFDDFASDAQRARGAAEKARIGPRLVPGARIVLDKIRLDGTLAVHADRLLGNGPSPFRSLDATIRLDDRRLVVSPLAVALPRGRVTGTASIDSRDRVPRLRLDLRIGGASIESFLPQQRVIAGPLRARLVMDGTGRTVRDALARGNGRVAFVVTDGSVRRDYATFLGGDVFKSIGAAVDGGDRRTELGCLVANFAVARGRMTPAPLVLSTPIARGDGAGAIMLGPETIDLRVTGRPTKPGLLLSTAPVRLFGTLSRPQIDIRPPRAKSPTKGGLLSRVGFFIKELRVRGDDGTRAAAPVACQLEARRALR